MKFLNKKKLTCMLLLVMITMVGCSVEDKKTETKENQKIESDNTAQITQNAKVNTIKEIKANYSKVKNLNISVNEEKEQVSIPIMVNNDTSKQEAIVIANKTIQTFGNLMYAYNNKDENVKDENGYKEFYKQYNVYIGVYYEKDSKTKDNWLVKEFIDKGTDLTIN